MPKPPCFRLAILAIGSAIATTHATAQEPAPAFVIKDREARTGSKFRNEIIHSGSVPINLPYERLSEEQKAVLKAPYESMGPEDEPPFPADGLKALVVEMQEAQRILQVRGNLRLHANVDQTGKVRSVTVIQSVERRFDLYVAGILMRTKFKPAKCGGEPCSQEYLFAWTLTLEPY